MSVRHKKDIAMALSIVINYGRDAELESDALTGDRPMSRIGTAALALSAALGRRGHEVHLFASVRIRGLKQRSHRLSRQGIGEWTEPCLLAMIRAPFRYRSRQSITGMGEPRRRISASNGLESEADLTRHSLYFHGPILIYQTVS